MHVCRFFATNMDSQLVPCILCIENVEQYAPQGAVRERWGRGLQGPMRCRKRKKRTHGRGGPRGVAMDGRGLYYLLDAVASASKRSNRTLWRMRLNGLADHYISARATQTHY